MNAAMVFSELPSSACLRQAVAFVAVDQARMANAGAFSIGFASTAVAPSALPGLVKHCAIYDAPTGGNRLLVFELERPIYVSYFSVTSFAAGSFTLNMPVVIVALANKFQATPFRAGAPLGTHGAGQFAPVYAGAALTVSNGVLSAG